MCLVWFKVKVGNNSDNVIDIELSFLLPSFSSGIPENANGCEPLKPTSQPKQPQPPKQRPTPVPQPTPQPPSTLPTSPSPPTKSPPRLPGLPQPPAPPTIPAPPKMPPAVPQPPLPSPTKPTDLSPTTPSPPKPPETHLTPTPTSLSPTMSPPSSSSPLPEWDNLALYYTFDNHKFPFITDVSGHSNRGQMSAGVNVVGVQNGCGLAGSFIGGSITLDGSLFHPKPTQAVTIGLWVKFSTTEGEQTLFTTSRQGSYKSNYYLASKSGKITWCHKNEQGEKLFEITTSESAVVAGQWSYVAATYDSSKGRIPHSSPIDI